MSLRRLQTPSGIITVAYSGRVDNGESLLSRLLCPKVDAFTDPFVEVVDLFSRWLDKHPRETNNRNPARAAVNSPYKILEWTGVHFLPAVTFKYFQRSHNTTLEIRDLLPGAEGRIRRVVELQGVRAAEGLEVPQYDTARPYDIGIRLRMR